tara:strand:+ start:428 stop:697 length:270 start_codon:yes stop_codon:yes gene_type:complete
MGKCMNQKTFFNYCWEFYGPNKIDGNVFDNNLTKKELQTAITIRSSILGNHKNTKYSFIPLDFDSLDRELTRDIILKLREPNKETHFFK